MERPLGFDYSSAGEEVKVETVGLALGALSGLTFVAPDLELPVRICTAVAMLVTYGIICRIFARQAGRSPSAWLAAGLLGGVFATALLLILGERGPRSA